MSVYDEITQAIMESIKIRGSYAAFLPMGSNGTVKSVKVKEVRLRRADISC
jgi:hypothetical protein